MTEQEYADYFRHESGDPADLAGFIAASLTRLAAAGIAPDGVSYQPDLHYAEINFTLTEAQARAMGYDDNEIARLVEEANPS